MRRSGVRLLLPAPLEVEGPPTRAALLLCSTRPAPAAKRHILPFCCRQMRLKPRDADHHAVDDRSNPARLSGEVRCSLPRTGSEPRRKSRHMARCHCIAPCRHLAPWRSQSGTSGAVFPHQACLLHSARNGSTRTPACRSGSYPENRPHGRRQTPQTRTRPVKTGSTGIS